jgi:hypothetical protein
LRVYESSPPPAVAQLFLVRCMDVRIIAVILCVVAVSGCDKFRSFVAAEPWKWSSSRIAETKRRGDVICHAIDAYRTKTGKYPSQLEDLQAEFLREIPQPTVGHKRWLYMLIDQRANYWLHVVASEFGPSLDKRADTGWEYMDDHGKRNI